VRDLLGQGMASVYSAEQVADALVFDAEFRALRLGTWLNTFWVPRTSSTSCDKAKSHARIASAWERRNCGQVRSARRGVGSIPAFFRISHTVDAAIFTSSPASSPWILRYPQSGFSRASRRTRALMFR
jgi:hypothetical protein